MSLQAEMCTPDECFNGSDSAIFSHNVDRHDRTLTTMVDVPDGGGMLVVMVRLWGVVVGGGQGNATADASATLTDLSVSRAA